MVAALLIPQLPTLLWCLATHSMVFFRGWINLEYLVLLGIAFLFPSWWTITLLTVEMCIALVEPIASLYYISPRDTLPSIRYLLLLPAPRLIEYGCLLIVYAISVAVALRATLGRYRRKDAKYMVALALACCLLALSTDLLLGRFSRFHIGKRLGDVDVREMFIARSPAGSIWFENFQRRNAGKRSSIPPLLLSSTLSEAMAEWPGWQQAGCCSGAYRVLGAGQRRQSQPGADAAVSQSSDRQSLSRADGERAVCRRHNVGGDAGTMRKLAGILQPLRAGCVLCRMLAGTAEERGLSHACRAWFLAKHVSPLGMVPALRI